MKFILSIFLVALVTYAVGIYGNLPWWSFVVTNCIIAIALPIKPIQSFAAGALGVGALWAGLAVGIDLSNNHILSTKEVKSAERFLMRVATSHYPSLQ